MADDSEGIYIVYFVLGEYESLESIPVAYFPTLKEATDFFTYCDRKIDEFKDEVDWHENECEYEVQKKLNVLLKELSPTEWTSEVDCTGVRVVVGSRKIMKGKTSGS